MNIALDREVSYAHSSTPVAEATSNSDIEISDAGAQRVHLTSVGTVQEAPPSR